MLTVFKIIFFQLAEIKYASKNNVITKFGAFAALIKRSSSCKCEKELIGSFRYRQQKRVYLCFIEKIDII